MLIRIILIVVFFTSLDAIAQITEVKTRNDEGGAIAFYEKNRELSSNGMWLTKYIDNNIKGTVFLYENWKNTMTIFTKDKKSFKLSNSNYDALKDDFASKISKDSIFIFNKLNIEYVKIREKIFKKYNYKNKEVFFNVLYDGKEIRFFKRYKVIVKEGSFNPMTQKKTTEDFYKLKEDYFINKGNKIFKIALKRKAVLEIIGKEAKAIRKYAKEHKLSFKKEKDLIEILKYMEKTY
ncbi:conserved hypothetical protein [Tenacibaculum maritimum]|uniref:hypothetical protein n=1 Tax=Tenacibaculum maritimum TaxID=107401 RepID=UPI0012E69D1B|nr:hypothetical protein [Tenacibaculum maritimum]CAA0218455.1 conserved hypothetical protein [Tenacibaculum maritimum]